MNRVLVTGASGLIGRHALAALAGHGYEVHAVARGNVADPSGLVIWHALDLHDPGPRRALVNELAPTHLLHLAWCTEHGAYWTSPANLDWVAASLMLVREFAEADGSRVVVAGTCAEYEWGGTGRLSESSSRLAPATLYGVAKLALLNVLSAFADTTGLSLAWGRIFSVYGPGEDPRRLVPSVALRLIEGQPGPPLSGALRRDYLYVEDAGRAFAELLDSRVEGPVNIASGATIELRELGVAIVEAAGRPDLASPGDAEPRAGEALEVSADVERLRQEVGFRPRIDLATGLERTIARLRSSAAAPRLLEEPG